MKRSYMDICETYQHSMTCISIDDDDGDEYGDLGSPQWETIYPNLSNISPPSDQNPRIQPKILLDANGEEDEEIYLPPEVWCQILPAPSHANINTILSILLVAKRFTCIVNSVWLPWLESLASLLVPAFHQQPSVHENPLWPVAEAIKKHDARQSEETPLLAPYLTHCFGKENVSLTREAGLLCGETHTLLYLVNMIYVRESCIPVKNLYSQGTTRKSLLGNIYTFDTERMDTFKAIVKHPSIRTVPNCIGHKQEAIDAINIRYANKPGKRALFLQELEGKSCEWVIWEVLKKTLVPRASRPGDRACDCIAFGTHILMPYNTNCPKFFTVPKPNSNTTAKMNALHNFEVPQYLYEKYITDLVGTI